MIRDLCLMYSLEHPLITLCSPPPKATYKNTVKSHVIAYWENLLRSEAATLVSLRYFDPNFMNLTQPHPIWTTPGSNQYEITKAVQQARFLSGRYRTESLARHWNTNMGGFCTVGGCDNTVETVEHILIECPSYSVNRQKLLSLWLSCDIPVVSPLIIEALSSQPSYLLQFIIDCSVLPNVIRARQNHGDIIFNKIFYYTRTWCYTLHKARMRLLNRWNFQ